ncbi:MAG: hypothetical protein GY950_06450 [bacterium]|nr:hypothetical protein [bacterium]
MEMYKISSQWVMVIGVIVMIAFAVSLFAGQQVEKDSIIRHSDEWKDIYREFTVDEGMVETLAAKTGDNLKIVVYLAFWCGDSKDNVPPFVKIVDKINEATGKNLPVDYFTVERKPNKDVKCFVEELKVERVPTFIFYRDGKEIGRIIENPKQSLVEDFLEIIF